MKKGMMKDYLRYSNHIGIVLVIWCFIYFAWFYIHPTDRMLYEDFLRVSFFYFSGMNLTTFIVSAIQCYLWGYVAVGTWVLASKISGINK